MEQMNDVGSNEWKALSYVIYVQSVVGLLETPINDVDHPIIVNAKNLYRSCLNISMIKTITFYRSFVR